MEITVATINVAGLLPSEESSKLEMTNSEVRDILLELVNDAGIDILCCQEWPKSNIDNLSDEWICCYANADTHCLSAVIFVRKSLVPLQPVSEIECTTRSEAPVLKVGPNCKKVQVISAHLPPGRNAERRIHFLKNNVLNNVLFEENVVPTILCGDMNMRQAEDQSVLDMGWFDCFVEAGKPRDAKFTWNSYVNKFNGQDKYEFYSRFDRIYFKGKLTVVPDTFRLFGNHKLPIEQGGAFFSDHFGLVQKFII